MRKQLSAPVSLMVIVAGVVLAYYVLHSQGWNVGGDVTLSYTYRSLSTPSRALVVVGFMMTAWGTGSLLNALLAAGKSSDQSPPAA